MSNGRRAWLSRLEEGYVNLGAALMYQKAMEHVESCPEAKDGNCHKHRVHPCRVKSDRAPLPGYSYALSVIPRNQQIVDICESTCCTVLQKKDSDEYFLVACATNKDVAQDIALAYVIAGDTIPRDVAFMATTQYGLQGSGEDWQRVLQACRDSLQQTAQANLEQVAKIERALAAAGLE